MTTAKKLSGKNEEKWQEKQGYGRKSLPYSTWYLLRLWPLAKHLGPVLVTFHRLALLLMDLFLCKWLKQDHISFPHTLGAYYGFSIANFEGVRETVICWNINWKYLNSIRSWQEASQWLGCPLPPFTCGRTWSITSLGSDSSGCLTAALHLSLLGLKVSNLH